MLKDSEIGNIAAIGPAGHPPCSKYERLIERQRTIEAGAQFAPRVGAGARILGECKTEGGFQSGVGDCKKAINLARSSADASPPYGFMLLPGTTSSGFAMKLSSFSLSQTKSAPLPPPTGAAIDATPDRGLAWPHGSGLRFKRDDDVIRFGLVRLQAIGSASLQLARFTTLAHGAPGPAALAGSTMLSPLPRNRK